MKGLENPDDVEVAKIIAAGVALHALIASPIRISNWTNAQLVDEAFQFADLFLARAMKEEP